MAQGLNPLELYFFNTIRVNLQETEGEVFGYCNGLVQEEGKDDQKQIAKGKKAKLIRFYCFFLFA